MDNYKKSTFSPPKNRPLRKSPMAKIINIHTYSAFAQIDDTGKPGAFTRWNKGVTLITFVLSYHFFIKNLSSTLKTIKFRIFFTFNFLLYHMISYDMHFFFIFLVMSMYFFFLVCESVTKKFILFLYNSFISNSLLRTFFS